MAATLQYDEASGELVHGGRMRLLTGVEATVQNLKTAFRTERGTFTLDQRVGFPANLVLRQGLIVIGSVGTIVDDVALRCSGVSAVLQNSTAERAKVDGVDVIKVTGLVVLDRTGESLEVEEQELSFG